MLICKKQTNYNIFSKRSFGANRVVLIPRKHFLKTEEANSDFTNKTNFSDYINFNDRGKSGKNVLKKKKELYT